MQNFHLIVSDYYAAKKGHPKDDFENIDAKFAQDTEPVQSKASPPPKKSDHGTLERKISLHAISPSPTVRKEMSDAGRAEAVKSVWSNMEEDI